MTGVPLDDQWPGLEESPSRHMHVDFDLLPRLAGRLQASAEKPGMTGTPAWIRAASNAGKPGPVASSHVVADLQWRLQARTTSYVMTVFDALPSNLRAVAERLRSASDGYRKVEDELSEQSRSPSIGDGRNWHGTASVVTGRPTASTRQRRILPPARPMRDTVTLGVLDLPAVAVPPRVDQVLPWLREMQKTAVWRSYADLAQKWRWAAEQLNELGPELRSLAGELTHAWYDMASPRAQSALQRIDGTARVLGGVSRALEARTAALARCAERVEDLRLHSWSRPDERVPAVCADLVTGYWDYLRDHPRTLSYDLPFGLEVPRLTSWPIVWPIRPETPPSLPPVVGSAPDGRAEVTSYDDFWTDPGAHHTPPIID